MQRENNMPIYKANSQGIEVFSNDVSVEKISWVDITKVEIIEHKGIEKMRPSFVVSYRDKEITVYQRINGYLNFYNLFKLRSIKGTETELKPYDTRDLNIYGEFTETGF